MGTSASKSRAAALPCLLAGLLPLIVAPSLPGCGCAAIGCRSGATISVDFPDDLAQLDGPMVTACFNDGCVSSPLPAEVSPGAGRQVVFPSNVEAILWAPELDGDRLEVRWWFSNNATLHAGDRYRVTVTTSSGAVIADKEATALRYDELETCSTACHNAWFAEAAAGPSP